MKSCNSKWFLLMSFIESKNSGFGGFSAFLFLFYHPKNLWIRKIRFKELKKNCLGKLSNEIGVLITKNKYRKSVWIFFVFLRKKRSHHFVKLWICLYLLEIIFYNAAMLQISGRLRTEMISKNGSEISNISISSRVKNLSLFMHLLYSPAFSICM